MLLIISNFNKKNNLKFIVNSYTIFFLYFINYNISLFIFLLFLDLLNKKKDFIFLKNIRGITSNFNLLKIIFIIIILSISNFPPFLGFYLKLLILENSLNNNINYLIIIIFFIILNFFCYLNIIKNVFFYKNIKNKKIKFKITNLLFLLINIILLFLFLIFNKFIFKIIFKIILLSII